MYLLVLMFNYILQPIPLLTSLGLVINTLDVIAAFRLCIALRQLKEHKRNHSQNQDISFTRSLITVFVAVYGGEALMVPFLGLTPSFVISPTIPALYAIVQLAVDSLPSVPPISLQSELPFAVIDGFTRALLLCTITPPMVIANSSSEISTSPWTLLLTPFVIANGGIFLVNLFSFLEPQPLTVTTPPELLPYGWATTELWSTPIITTIHAILTHAQPFWAQAHTLLAGTSVEPVDPDVARTTCAILMAAMYVGRTFNKFGIPTKMNKIKTKSKTQ